MLWAPTDQYHAQYLYRPTQPQGFLDERDSLLQDRVPLLTGSAEGGMFSLPNRLATTACTVDEPQRTA